MPDGGIDDPLRLRLRRRESAANLQTTQHAFLRDFYGRWSEMLTIVSLLLTASLLPLALVSDTFAEQAFHLGPTAFKMANAAVAVIAFSFVLVQLVWKPDSRSAAHRAAVGHFANAKFEFRALLEQPNISSDDVRLAESKYLDVRNLPPIPERWFLPTKKWHAQKLRSSRELDSDPAAKIAKLSR